MYHKINLPECAPHLMRLTQIAGHTIAFALSHDRSIADEYVWDGTEQAALADSLGKEFLAEYNGHLFLAAVRDHFYDHFEAECKREVGVWLWNKYATVAKPVIQLLVIPLEQKSGILEAFKQDVELETLFHTSSSVRLAYQQLPATCATAKSILKALLENFYEVVLTGKLGVRGDIVDIEEALDHQAVLQAYHRANLNLKVCPGCDGERPRARTIRSEPGKLLFSANIDHFFPKSEYPFLAVHPFNLVPMCSACNQERKGSKDVLQARGVTTFDDIYHPYFRGAHGEVQVIIERDARDNRPHLRLKPQTEDVHSIARLNSLEHILGLEGDWDGDLQDGTLDAHVESALRYITQDERYADKRHKETWLSQQFADVSRKMTHDIGSISHSVASQAYANWLATEAIAQQERVRLFNKALGIEPGVVNPTQQQIHPRAIP